MQDRVSGVYLVGCMALVAQATVLLSSGGQATQLAVLVHWVHDPVDAGVLQTDNTVICALLRVHTNGTPAASGLWEYTTPICSRTPQPDAWAAAL